MPVLYAPLSIISTCVKTFLSHRKTAVVYMRGMFNFIMCAIKGSPFKVSRFLKTILKHERFRSSRSASGDAGKASNHSASWRTQPPGRAGSLVSRGRKSCPAHIHTLTHTRARPAVWADVFPRTGHTRERLFAATFCLHLPGGHTV